MRLFVKNGLVLQSNGTFLKGYIGIDKGRIAALWYGETQPLCANDGYADAEVIDAERCLVSPGFIDTHMHGGLGFDFCNEKPGWEKLQERLSSKGVTSILSTVSSLPPDETLASIDRIAALVKKNDAAKVDIVGIHMEGPYINKNRKGIHPELCIRLGDKDEVARILERAGGLVKVWTLAPDFEENLAVTKILAAAGISVSIAHTEADYKTAMAAFSAGANRVTHTFNTMPTISHRYEGIISAAWQHGAFMELIADGYHVSPTIVKMFISASDPGKIVLVSDNNEFSGLPEGSYVQDDHHIIIADGQMKTDSGTLAGSNSSLNQCALNLTRWGFPAGTALKMATENPARAAGVFDRKGSIAPGKDADLVILDGQFEAMVTIKGGKVVYRTEKGR